MKGFVGVCLLVAFFLPLVPIAQHQVPIPAGQEARPKYGYYYKGKFISLSASKRLVAISEAGVAFGAFVRAQGLTRDPLSERAPLKKRNLGLYSLPIPKTKTEERIDLQAQMENFFKTTHEEIQPVFEQGQALLIPSDEVIVAFKEATNFAQAQSYLEPYRKTQGILEVREHLKNTYVLRIDNPAKGRVYQVCQSLGQLDEIDFAEPNHIVVFLYEPRVPMPPGELARVLRGREEEPKSGRESEVLSESFYETRSSVGWTVLIDESFEGASLPAGWSTGRWGNEFTDAYWSVTNYRSHAGTRSIYATGGGTEGVAPPGRYPNNSKSWLDTPRLNLASYEEVYIELWFYAKFGVHSKFFYDLGLVEIGNPQIDYTPVHPFYAFWVGYTGDLTADPTTDQGWRRALFRVPPSARLDSVNVRFVFISDDADTEEGLYIDQVRVVGTPEVDTDPLGDDSYGARLYELKNAGQIAGLGNDDNDLHVPEAWELVSVSPDVVVAVIDEGVDLQHRDLNLVTGYEPFGSQGGGARGPHGTAVAGNVGAIRGNALGVMGTAPGVKIMPVYMGGTTVEIALAIGVAVVKGADILSNSWSLVGAPSPLIEGAITAALIAGRVVLFAAGNGPPPTYEVAFPGNLTGSTAVICVGASSPTDEHKDAASSDGQFWWGSSYVGSGPDIVAPGPWSYATDITGAGGYNDGSLIDPQDPASADYTPTFGGTSSATPKVAGIVALMLSANPDLRPPDVKRILRETANDIDVAGYDDKTGAGRVNAYEAVKRAQEERVKCPIISSLPPSGYGGQTLVYWVLLLLPAWLGAWLAYQALRRRKAAPA